MVSSRWRPAAIDVVARLDIAEKLRNGPRDVADLARACRVSEDGLYRVLRALARDGVFDEEPPRRFALTPLSRPLLRDEPGSIRSMVLMMGADWSNSLWANLGRAVETGEEIFTPMHGRDLWGYFEDHPQDRSHFDGGMAELTRQMAPAIAAAYNFSRFSVLVDLGGGSGELLGAILKSHPTLRAIDFDFPGGLENAMQTLARHGVLDRCEIVAGNFFESVPADKDAYMMKNIVHGLSDDKAAHLLRLVRQAMRAGGKLLLVEHVVPERGPYMSFLDLTMLLNSAGGRERTRAELEELLASAGFGLDEVVATPSPMSLIVASPR
jgi:precorrin-6B methylase 2